MDWFLDSFLRQNQFPTETDSDGQAIKYWSLVP